jgi:hypothetical protein
LHSDTAKARKLGKQASIERLKSRSIVSGVAVIIQAP